VRASGLRQKRFASPVCKDDKPFVSAHRDDGKRYVFHSDEIQDQRPLARARAAASWTN
jgi:hypothetical protein